MADTKTEKLWKAEDLISVPNPEARYEIVMGELVEKGPMGGLASVVAKKLFLALVDYERARRVGEAFPETEYLLRRDPDLLRKPDVSFVLNNRLPSRLPEGAFELAPDIAVEVVSPSNRPGDVVKKAHLYLEHDVRLVWVVDPFDRTVKVYKKGRRRLVLHDEEAIDGEDVLPGFLFPLERLFAGLPAEDEPTVSAP